MPQHNENEKREHGHSAEPILSILYTTYNHEDYIETALKGFLSQRTKYPFEIIIHDDASCDNSPSIISTYAKKYPHLIRTIFQKENQFSKSGKNVLALSASYARGQYIACCEGDDFWIDPLKIEIQLSEMMKFPDCEMSFHSAITFSEKRRKTNRIISRHSVGNHLFSAHDVILGGASFCPTASLIIKKEIFNELPSWFFQAPVGDYFLQILGSLKGGALYIDRVMSSYRLEACGSWTQRMRQDGHHALHYLVNMTISLEAINEHTNRRFSKELTQIAKKMVFYMCRNPLFSLNKRIEIFKRYNYLFDLKMRIFWYLLFRNTVLCRTIHHLRNIMLVV